MRATGAGAAMTAIGLSVVAVACGSNATQASRPSVTRPRSTTTRAATTTEPATSTTAAPTTTTTPVTAPPTTAPPVVTTPPTHTPTTASPATAPPSPASPVTRVAGIGSAQQVITVSAAEYGTSIATVTAYERSASGWQQVFGPWTADVGRNGVAPPGAKREGDGRTPSGVYGFDFMFGVDPDPGVHYPFRRITGSNIVWDDDPDSANYNEWIDTRTAPAGVNPEPMYDTPSYFYGAVIAYNDARTPGLGSAIFLHVSHNSSTAGCVALPSSELLDLLRWLDPARSPRIAIGTAASLAGG